MEILFMIIAFFIVLVLSLVVLFSSLTDRIIHHHEKRLEAFISKTVKTEMNQLEQSMKSMIKDEKSE